MGIIVGIAMFDFDVGKEAKKLSCKLVAMQRLICLEHPLCTPTH